MQFDDVIGQDHIKQQLRKNVTEGRVPHALLFFGAPGTGKLPMALAYASALLCSAPENGKACGKCRSCLMTKQLAHPDLHFVFPVVKPRGRSGDITSDYYLPQWRELLRVSPYFDYSEWLSALGVENQQALIYAAESDSIVAKLSIAPSQGGYRVMVLWRPELMNAAAANKLLKILEEPPAKTVFLLVSDRPDLLLPTILSRTQRVAFPPLPEQVLAEALETRSALQPSDAAAVAHIACGSYARALGEVRSNEEETLFFDLFVVLMRQSYMRQVKGLYEWAEQLASWGRERQKSFLQYCQRLIRENFVYNFRRPQLNYLTAREAEFSSRFARFVNERNVIGISGELAAAQRDIEQNVNPHMVFFDLALKMIMLLIQ